jgi:hypothetical protein
MKSCAKLSRNSYRKSKLISNNFVAKDDLRKNGQIFTGKLYAANFDDGCACILWSETMYNAGGGQTP